VICEIMNDDGTMARMPDLERFADTHGLRILSIADLVQYRLEHEQLIEKRLEGELPLPHGKAWRAHLFAAVPSGREFLALTLGELDESPTLVRMHTGSVIGDILEVGDQVRLPMRAAMRRIEVEGRGVVVFIASPLDLHADLSGRLGLEVKRPRLEGGEVLREYGLGAQVLRALGLRRVRLLTNRPRKIPGLEGYGLEVVDQLTVNESDGVLRH
jgi:3,4-dihydroxy 2-butanone 4-phosphate synthase/GTP cyclohydrolase II